MEALKLFSWRVGQYELSNRRSVVIRNDATRAYPLGELSPIHREFSDSVKDAESALLFVRHYGFLGLSGDGPDVEEENVEDILDQRKALRGFISQINHDPGYIFDHATALAQLFNDHAAPAISTELEASNGRFALKIVPRSLVAYMWLQVASELIDGIEWRICANPKCSSKRFPVRLNDLRQKDKIFCGRAACHQAVSRQRRDEQQRATKWKGTRAKR